MEMRSNVTLHHSKVHDETIVCGRGLWIESTQASKQTETLIIVALRSTRSFYLSLFPLSLSLSHQQLAPVLTASSVDGRS